jgi:F-type H+-transporting ATPase subunit b
MLIDWFTVAAQILNFLILVWLLKRFLYQPILQAIDDREKKIATELKNADDKKAEAQKERDEFKRKNDEFDQQRAKLLIQVTDEVKTERQRLLDEAAKAAEALQAKRLESLRNEEQHLSQAISLRTQKEVFEISRKVLTDLAGISLEERMVEVFIHRLSDLPEEKKRILELAIHPSAKTSPSAVIIQTRFNLSPAQRLSTQEMIKKIFGSDLQFDFKTVPDLMSGIELSTNGQKISWSIEDYMDSLEKGVADLLRTDGKEWHGNGTS